MILIAVFIMNILTLGLAKPIENQEMHSSENGTESNNIGSTSIFCNVNRSLEENIDLVQLFNESGIWYVPIRSKSVFKNKTWLNTVIKTSRTDKDSMKIEFRGENSDGNCVDADQLKISQTNESRRINIRWSDREGFLEILFVDQSQIHVAVCYGQEEVDVCSENQLEHLIITKNKEHSHKTSIDWLKSHCSNVDDQDFVIAQNLDKCLSTSLESSDSKTHLKSGKESDTSDEDNDRSAEEKTMPSELNSETDDQSKESETTMSHHQQSDADNSDESTDETTRRPSSLIESDTVTNLIALESSTESSDNEATTVTETLVDSTVVAIENETSSIIEEIVSTIENYLNDTIDANHETNNVTIENTTVVESAVYTSQNESSTFMDTENVTKVTSDEISSAVTSNSSESTEQEDLSTANFYATEPLENDNATESLENENVTSSELNVSLSDSVHKSGEFESIDIQTSSEPQLETTMLIKTTSPFPVDCPELKSCNMESCRFGRKTDNRGCPTCTCRPPTEGSNVTCSKLTCSACLYGHEIDSDGCPTCQCQYRPYPNYGERCPHLNCEPCYFGTVKDEFNCDTCICIRPNNEECPKLNCMFGSCKYGSVVDKDDCPTCDCLLPTTNSSLMNCTISHPCPPCYLGYVKDADGCQTCQCKQRSSVSCPSMSLNCQCAYGSYLDPNGCETCSCLPDPTTATKSACWEVKSQMAEISCASDGSFSNRQCNSSDSTCWCVTTHGIHIDGFQSRIDENVNCACAVELYQVSNLRMIGHQLSCLSNGNYAPIQCNERYCSCVDDNGKPIGPSVSNQNRDLLRCVGVYQHLHPDRFVLQQNAFRQSNSSNASESLPLPLCIQHLEQVRKADIDDHILIPTCDSNGLYESVQCDQTGRYCWCVDKKTGVELEGTRRLNARPNCSNF